MTLRTTFAAGVAAMLLAAGGLCAQQDLEALVDKLGSGNAQDRANAYNELMRRRAPEVVALLGKKVLTFPPGGQQFAVYLLQQQPIEQTRAVYEKLVDAEPPLLRAAAAAALARNGDKGKLAVLAKAIASAGPDERIGVLNSAWGFDDPRVLAAIRDYLRPDGNSAVVTSALQHLRQNEKGRSPATEARAVELTTAGDVAVRAAALAWLAGGEGDPHALALAELLRDDPQRFWAIDRLLDRDRKLAAPLVEAIAKALAGARSKYDVTQTAALLRSQSADLAAQALRQLLDKGSDDVRAAALEALAALPGGLEPKLLRDMLQNGTPAQQIVAASTLRRMDDPSGLPVLLALLPKAGADKAECARALAGFRSRDVIPPLLGCLDDTNQMVRQYAWNGLQTLLRDLFPYRRFDFAKSGYDPNGGNRSAGIATLRAWYAAVK